MVFKCKMCGAQMEISEGMTVAECGYCGTQQTLPKTDSEQNLNLFNRANHFRQQCEFDKAAEIYEKMASGNSNDAELYWSIVLCRYGIEYVDDPATKKKVATCHRTQFKSILDDPDYNTALEHADVIQREVYEREAKYIDTVQKGILEISNKEKPFDVFICYKETDESGRRTQDSVLAQDLYYGLVNEGFKVFFSRITLESKLGTEYEPYIFAALNSAKVMVVVGTKPEYFNAVWVKNEWSRYLMLMQKDRSRTLIPAYKDMDPYDLPDALSMFQSQDMSKIGFLQDLLRGIRKIAKNEPEKADPVVQQTVMQTTSKNVENLLKRGNLALEDEKWDDAKKYFEDVLNENVEEYRAYIGLLCAEKETVNEQGLTRAGKGFTDSDNYKKACRFGGREVEERLFNLNQQSIYNDAVFHMSKATSSYQFLDLEKIFISLNGFSDSEAKADECAEKARIQKEKVEAARKEDIYKGAITILNASFTARAVEKAIKEFERIPDYKDSKEQIEKCNAKIAEFEAEFEKEEQARITAIKRKQEKKKKIIIASIVSVLIAGAIAGGVVLGINIYKSIKYDSAVELFENQKYDEALEKFIELDDYKDSNDKILAVKYDRAIDKFNNGDYHGALSDFNDVAKYKFNNDYYGALSDFNDVEKYKEAYVYLNNYKLKLLYANEGDVVRFGKYDWYIIEKNENSCKLLCKNKFTEMPYNEGNEETDVTWEECSLRKWLNNDFYNEFTDEEKASIETVHNINADNSVYGTEGGNDTDDNVYLLSIDEAKKLNYNIHANEWLRFPGSRQYRVATVNSNGINTDGINAICYAYVAPVITLKLDW